MVNRRKLLLLVAVAAWGCFAVWTSIRPYNLMPDDVFINDRRSPEENVDMIVAACPSVGVLKSQAVCECFMDQIYTRTSRVERVVFLYGKSLLVGYNIRTGAEAIGLSREDLNQIGETARQKIAALADECKGAPTIGKAGKA